MRTLPMEAAAAALGGRHSIAILWSLFWEEKRFFQILHEVPRATRRAIVTELDRLERQGLIERRAGPAGNSRLTWALTPLGQTLKPALCGLYDWGLMASRLPNVGQDEPAGEAGVMAIAS
jgi:DNA-binding HxlR family transcriptional regulator